MKLSAGESYGVRGNRESDRISDGGLPKSFASPFPPGAWPQYNTSGLVSNSERAPKAGAVKKNWQNVQRSS
jgi:hypothetical protein